MADADDPGNLVLDLRSIAGCVQKAVSYKIQ